jgi:hypothetical protein
LVVTYVARFIKYTTRLKPIHEDVQIQLFLFNIPIEIRMWLAKCLKPKSVSSLTHLITKFLEYWGPSCQTPEDTIQELEVALQEEETFEEDEEICEEQEQCERLLPKVEGKC